MESLVFTSYWYVFRNPCEIIHGRDVSVPKIGKNGGKNVFFYFESIEEVGR